MELVPTSPWTCLLRIVATPIPPIRRVKTCMLFGSQQHLRYTTLRHYNSNSEIQWVNVGQSGDGNAMDRIGAWSLGGKCLIGSRTDHLRLLTDCKIARTSANISCSTRSSTPNSSMNQPQYAPAATAGGQQNGPVSHESPVGCCTYRSREVSFRYRHIDTAIDNQKNLRDQNATMIADYPIASLPELRHLDDALMASRRVRLRSLQRLRPVPETAWPTAAYIA